MNIIVKPYGSGLCYCRPDTTWERENRDFYSPECVNEVLWAPVVFARVSKAGKCVGQKFTHRYYDGVGCGMLMYCRVSEPAVPCDTPPYHAITSCADHTSILPMPLYDPVVLEDEKVFEVIRNGESLVALPSNADTVISTETSASVVSTKRSEWRDLLEEAICKASQLTSLRIGDFVAVELAPVSPLGSREDKEISIKGIFCENETFHFRMHL